MTFDDLIAQGIREILEEKCAEYCPTGENHRFSIAYKIIREMIIRFHVKSAPSVRSVNIILGALISVLFVLLGSGLFMFFVKGGSK